MWQAINGLFEAIEELIGIFCSGVWRGVEGTVNFLRGETEEAVRSIRQRARLLRRPLLVLLGTAIFSPLLFFIIGILSGAKLVILIGILISSISIMIIGFYIPFWGYVIALAFSASREFAEKIVRGIAGIIMWELVVATYCLILPIETSANSTIAVLMGAVIFALAVAHWKIKSNLLKRLVICSSILLLVFGTLSLILPATFNTFSVEKAGVDRVISKRAAKEMKNLSRFLKGEPEVKFKTISPHSAKVGEPRIKSNFNLIPSQQISTGIMVKKGDEVRIEIDNPVQIGISGFSKWRAVNESWVLPIKVSGELLVKAGDKPVKGNITIK